MDTEQILALLQIANLALQWPELKPLHDRAMEKLREFAAHPAHQTPAPTPPVMRAPAAPFRRAVDE